MIRRTLLACLLPLLAAAPAAAQGTATVPDPRAPPVGEARLIARLPVPGGTRAASGALSPDGTRYVFGAMAGDSLQLWLLDVRTRALRLLTPGGGRRHDPAWSPDGTRLAYWGSNGPLEGIFVLDLASGRESQVWTDTAETAFVHTPRWLGSDSLQFSRVDVFAMGPDEPWIVGAEGGPARRTDWPALEARVRRGDTRGAPYFSRCCGGGREGLWLGPAPGDAGRCLAGPIGSHRREAAWSSGRIAFPASRGMRDTLFDLYAADPARPGARRVRAPGGIGGLSTSAAGDVALLVHPAPGAPSELWIIPAGRLREDPRGDTLAACPDPPAEIGAFLQARQVPGVRTVTVMAEEPRERLAFFSVQFGREMDYGVYESREGVAFRGRVGWLLPSHGFEGEDTRTGLFDVGPGDAYLWSRELLGRLAGTRLGRIWTGVLLADPDVPAGALAMLVDSAARTEDADLAHRLLGAQRVQASHRWLIRLGGIPWPRGENPAWSVLWPVARQAIADPRTPEPVLFALASQLPGPYGGRNDSTVVPVARALAANPVARRSARILQRLALLQAPGGEGEDVRRGAAERLFAHGQAADSLLLPVVQALARDTARARRLLDEPAVRRSAWLTAQLATPMVPEDVLHRAVERVLADSAAPPAALASLGWMIRQLPDSASLLDRTASHPAARGNGPLLARLLRERRWWDATHRLPRLTEPLAAVLRDPATDERALYRIALELREARATPSLMQLLGNPRARGCAPVLQAIAEMSVPTYTPTAGPHVPDPHPAAVRDHAGALLAALLAAGPAPPCDVGAEDDDPLRSPG